MVVAQLTVGALVGFTAIAQVNTIFSNQTYTGGINNGRNQNGNATHCSNQRETTQGGKGE